EADLVLGRLEDTRARLEPLVSDPTRQAYNDTTPLMPLLAWVHLEQGQQRQAEDLLERAETQAQAQRHHLALLDILRVRGLLRLEQRRWRESEDAIEQALALARRMPFPYAEAKALYVYGQLRVAMGERAQAREKYKWARSICERLGEGLYRPHIEQALA